MTDSDINHFQKTTETGYLLVAGYIREFCSIFKLSGRITFRTQLTITMYCPRTMYHIFVQEEAKWKKFEVFSLLCDDIHQIRCHFDRFIFKTILNNIYFSQNYGASQSCSGFYQLPQNIVNKKKRNDSIAIVSDGKFAQHVILVSAKGKFYGFGDNSSGQYGCGKRVKTQNGTHYMLDETKMFALKNLQRIFHRTKLKTIKCGADHTVFLATNGTVWSCGENKFGQIGIVNNYHNDPYLADKLYQLQPTMVPFLYHITEIECGRKHNLALDESGNVWGWGFNEYGQLGFGGTDADKQYVDVAIMNRFFVANDLSIMQIKCGYDFSLCLDQRGHVWLFGSNECGQLGNGRDCQYRVSIPNRPFYTRIRSASLGYNHTALVDVFNNIWTFGANHNFQCSVVSDRDRNIVRPYVLEKAEIGISRRRRIYECIAGHSTTLIVTSSVLYYQDLSS